MKQKFLTLALTYATVILFINACKNETSRQDDASENALLHNRVEVRSTVKYADSRGIEKMYLETLCDAVLLSKIQAKDFPFQTFVFDSLNSISIDEIKNNLGIIENKTNFKEEIAGICFIENWSMNEKTLKFSKEIKHVCPVRIYENKNIKGEQLLTVPFTLPVKDLSSVENKNLELFAKNVAYMMEFNPLDPEYPAISGLNSKKIVDLLVDGSMSGKQQVYDFDLNTMNRSEKILSKEEILKLLGQRVDTIPKQDMNGNVVGTVIDTLFAKDLKYLEIKAVFFIENWYYDKTNFNVKKEILGYGPVRYYQHPYVEGQVLKSVPFIIKN